MDKLLLQNQFSVSEIRIISVTVEWAMATGHAKACPVGFAHLQRRWWARREGAFAHPAD
jgi:hypothetical protein